jgi:hypothetical protein
VVAARARRSRAARSGAAARARSGRAAAAPQRLRRAPHARGLTLEKASEAPARAQLAHVARADALAPARCGARSYHQYKFIVDGKWQHEEGQAFVTDPLGNTNNWRVSGRRARTLTRPPRLWHR